MAGRGKKQVAEANPDISQMAMSIFDKVRAIKRAHPAVSRSIDGAEREIRDKLAEIRAQIDRLEHKEDRDLVTVLVINGIHRTTDEVLVE